MYVRDYMIALCITYAVFLAQSEGARRCDSSVPYPRSRYVAPLPL